MEFAAGALGTLLPKLGQLLQDEYNLHKSAKKNIKFLTTELQSIQAALRSVGEVPPDQLSELVKSWAREARELSYDMEDIVDTFLVRAQGPDERPSRRSTKRFIKKLVKKVANAKTRRDIGQEIKDIKERVRDLAERRDRYKFDDITPAKTFGVDPRITSLYAKVADLIGVEKKSEELYTRFSPQQRIVSVVGIGGLGKTTLAKVVFDKHKGYFDCTAFVSVGRNPDLKNFLKKILVYLDEERYMNFNFSVLDDETQFINELRDFLENKRYFIVIDDIWDTKSWEIIKLALDVDNNSGGRIIITTRKHEVAGKAGGIYELEPLSDDNSRKLFFARISNNQPDDELYDKILKKCGGIPLAIITMASLLEGKHMEEWSEVLCSIGFGITENPQVENTKKIISFSYYDLPSHLRTCLLYLSVFPEDYFIEKYPLIWMWIAEDLVHKKQGKSLFEIGEGYFNELVNRSMIQLIDEWDEAHRKFIPGCQVHDMVWDLICSISSEENFVTVLDDNEGSSSSQGKVRRLALQNNRTVRAHVEDMRQVRSFISCGCDIDNWVPLSIFKLVRVLYIYTHGESIKRCHLKHLPNLLHLRYLRLSTDGWRGVVFLEEIGTLKFLQTLDVKGYLSEERLASLCHLTQLLCLRLNEFCSPRIFPIRKLTSLEELDISVGYIGGEEESWRRFVKDLGSLRELRVLRLVTRHSLSTEVQIDLVESLRNLRKIVHLFLDTHKEYADTATWKEAGFALPPHLQRLFIGWISFSRFPSFCVIPSHLRYLSHLSLRVDAIDEQELQILGQLPELRFLILDVKSTAAMVFSTTTDTAGDGGCFFQKLRHCRLNTSDVQVLPSKDDSCSVPFRMRYVQATARLGTEWKGVSSGKDLLRTLIPRAYKLWFEVSSVPEFMDGNYGVSLCLEYFASLQNISVLIVCDGASDSEVEEVEASLQLAADVHRNHPTLETRRYGCNASEMEMVRERQY